MLFNGEDVLAVLLVASSACQILRDLADKTGNVEIHEHLKALIRPGMEGKFWQAFNSAASYLKHADRDPDEVLTFDDDLPESIIIYCCMYFSQIAKITTAEMRALRMWYGVMNPDLVIDGTPAKALVEQSNFADWRRGSRADRLAHGRELLAAAMARHLS